MSFRPMLFGILVFAFVATGGRHCLGQGVARAYNISRLPVWQRTTNGTLEFDPSFVVNAIKRNIDRGSWGTKGASIYVHRESRTLIILQSQAHHKEIADLMDDLTPRDRPKP
jgi:hypothetical protein